MSYFFGLRPWLVACATDDSFRKQEGRMLKVCRHAQGPMADGSTIKEISDSAVFTFAAFTKESLEQFEIDWLEDDEDSQLPCWDSSMIIVRKYELRHRLHTTREKCDYLLTVREFVMSSVEPGFRLNREPKYIMDVRAVRNKSNALWQENQDQQQQMESSAADSQFSNVDLSLLLLAMEKIDDDGEPGSPGREPVAGPSGCSNVGAASSRLRQGFRSLQLPRTIECERFIISKPDAKKLSDVEAWYPVPQPPSPPKRSSDEWHDAAVEDEDEASLSAFHIPRKKRRSSVQRKGGEDKKALPTESDEDKKRGVPGNPMVFKRQRGKRKMFCVPQPTVEGLPMDSASAELRQPACKAKSTHTTTAGADQVPDSSSASAATCTRPVLTSTSCQVSQSLFADKHSQGAQVGLSLLGNASQESQLSDADDPIGDLEIPCDPHDAGNKQASDQTKRVQSTQVDEIRDSQLPQPDFPLSPVLIPLASQQLANPRTPKQGPRDEYTTRKIVIAVPKETRQKHTLQMEDRSEEERLEILQTPTKMSDNKLAAIEEKSSSNSVVLIDSTMDNRQPGEAVSRVQERPLDVDGDSIVLVRGDEIDIDKSAAEHRPLAKSKTRKGYEPLLFTNAATDPGPSVVVSSSTSSAKTTTQKSDTNVLKPDVKRKGGTKSTQKQNKCDSSVVVFAETKHKADKPSKKRKHRLLAKYASPFAECPKEEEDQEDISNPAKDLSTGFEMKQTDEEKNEKSDPSSSGDSKKHSGKSPASSGEGSFRLTVRTPVNSLPSHQPPKVAAGQGESPLLTLPQEGSTSNSTLLPSSALSVEHIQALLQKHNSLNNSPKPGITEKLQRLTLPDHLRAPLATYFCTPRTSATGS